MYSIHINYIFATSWFFCLFLPTSPFKAVCENEASQTVNSRIGRARIFINEVILLKFIFVLSSQTNSLLSLKRKSVPN